MRYLLVASLSLLIFLMVGFRSQAPHVPKMSLSDYGFFQGNPADQIPVEGVVPYQLNSPLFSDYAQKLRFVQLPSGATVPYNDREVLDFPIGTTIIKTFYYPKDARKPQKGRQLMETRLLIHEEKGWKALAYHWNEAQTDAILEVAGGTKAIQWTDASGKKHKLDYAFPNLNQCKGCHSYDGEMRPIGPSVRQLNGTLEYGPIPQNQLQYWSDKGLLTGLPALTEAPRAPVWNDPSTGTLDERARIYLDINCAHCHNAHGPAYTSGFFLDVHQTDPVTWGIYKSPVAAGRGAGERAHDIVPGQPDQSILYYRMDSNDPGIMMPEVGRKVLDKEGLSLIHDWISTMDPKDFQ